MNTKTVIEALEKLRKDTKKLKFSQTIDLIISLKHFNPKKGEKIDDYVQIKYPFKKLKFCALVGKELAENAKKNCETTIIIDEFENWTKTPREIKKLVRKHDYFFAQANLMPDIARTFGKYLGTKGKMPNPKLGQIIPPNGDLTPAIARLKSTTILKTKNQPNLHMSIGNEEMKNEEIAENAIIIIEKVIRDLPNGKQQLKHAYIKKTMSKTIKLE
ncbi:MAG: hypothetical protein GON13_02385 [Nanoarchaeota archaeon]|nr:hypothetical protein [Nanoarchaeota archaeon]